jgi:hypothetical protein
VVRAVETFEAESNNAAKTTEIGEAKKMKLERNKEKKKQKGRTVWRCSRHT